MVCAEFLVESAVAEHVIGGGEDRGGNGANRLLRPTPMTQALELGL